MGTAYLGIGSNLGHREKLIAAAINSLESTRGIVVETASGLYETDPVGGPAGQPRFLNAVVKIKTRLAPHRLLAVLNQIEKTLGRERKERWGPRTIDLDILLYDQRVVSDDTLTVPHPLMHERRFVMEPLVEIAPEVVHPVLQMTAKAILDSLGTLASD